MKLTRLLGKFNVYWGVEWLWGDLAHGGCNDNVLRGSDESVHNLVIALFPWCGSTRLHDNDVCDIP